MPTYDLFAILISIQSFLDEPDFNSAVNSNAAQLFRENWHEYERRVRAIVEESWLLVDASAPIETPTDPIPPRAAAAEPPPAPV